ncbi:hypothetical protein [Marinilabilia sp.]|nr:hypothetical protein [Marinilabilia sp.]
MVPNEEIVVDTSKYLKEVDGWVNLATFSHRIGVNATGWSVDYYGYQSP